MSDLMKDISRDMSSRLIMMRRQAGLSQAELAIRLDISQPTVANYESGKTEIPFSRFFVICALCGVSLDQCLPKCLSKFFSKSKAELEQEIAK